MVAFPLLLIPLAASTDKAAGRPVASIALKSGANWNITVGDALLTFAVFLLMIEMVKAARPGAKTITETLLAILLCGGAIAEFVLLPPFATSVFFLLIAMTVVDVLGSLAIGRHSRRRAAVATPAAPFVERRAVEPVIVPPIEPASPVDVRPEPVVPEELRTAPPAAADAPADDTAPRKSPYTPDGVPTP